MLVDLLLTVALLTQPGSLAQQRAPAGWVAFSADLKISMAGKPDAWGKFVQDEHGCRRSETVNPTVPRTSAS